MADAKHRRGASGASAYSLPDPSDALAALAEPPTPARVRGQRASTRTHNPRAASPQTHSRHVRTVSARTASPQSRPAARSQSQEAAEGGRRTSTDQRDEARRRKEEEERRAREEEERKAVYMLPGEEVDDFGLPIRKVRRSYIQESDTEEEEGSKLQDIDEESKVPPTPKETPAAVTAATTATAAGPLDRADESSPTATAKTVPNADDAKVEPKATAETESVQDVPNPKSPSEPPFSPRDDDSDAFESAEESPEGLVNRKERKPSKSKDGKPGAAATAMDPQADKARSNTASDAAATSKSEPLREDATAADKAQSPTGETGAKAPSDASAVAKAEGQSTETAPKDTEAADDQRPSTPDRPIEPPEETPEQHRKAQAEKLEQIFETTLQRDDIQGVSAVSHQALATRKRAESAVPVAEPDEWQDMRAYGKFDVYDDDGHIVAKGMESDSDDGLGGGARKGYTKLTFDEDAQSQTSMDENTSYLFADKSRDLFEEDEEARGPMQQMQATKDMLTEGQRIAYVGLTRLSIAKMSSDLDNPWVTKKLKRDYATAVDAMKMWGQKMMVRLYAHMEIESTEQIMIEQLTQHGVQPSDLTPLLMQNARVKNPMAGENSAGLKVVDPKSPKSPHSPSQPSPASSKPASIKSPPPYTSKSPTTQESADDMPPDGPPAYEDHKDDELTIRSPGMLPATREIDIDVRWTVLCDLFLVLIADSIYDARSRNLLEMVGGALDVSWMDICRFEKRVTDALEMEEEANRENWDETDNVETRRKAALTRRYVMMGLATVGGGLVIGLSAGLLAPVIGAGLGAGLSAIGVAGTTSFMAGAGGAAIITASSATAGGIIAVRASNRRTGAVKVFEYRPLHNNKRVNLILTVSGWMNGKVDDVRLPFSTVDPVMGDIYSLLWEPDVLQSTGDTIRILATEALTQGLQQVLAATFLTTLMAGLSLPIILSKLSYLIDNPWSVSLDRADAAGLILADSLISRNLGVRPITLVGFSLGARVIFSALRELANRGAYGLVHNVYLFGSPILAREEDYLRARTVVSGRFVNGYATNDWIIGYLFRATSGGLSRVAGLKAVEKVPGLENLDVTALVNGHMAYRAAMPRLLREVGWEVESDEFAEIEDPDPENHDARQRELIREIDSARQDAEKQPEAKGRWASFWQKKKEKKRWETYNVNAAVAATEKKEGPQEDPNAHILFDIDAIRRELESEHLEVRQLESTLPPMRLDVNQSATEPNGVPSTEKRAAVASPTSPRKSKDRPDQWEEYDEGADGEPTEHTATTVNTAATSTTVNTAATGTAPPASKSPLLAAPSTPTWKPQLPKWAKRRSRGPSPQPSEEPPESPAEKPPAEQQHTDKGWGSDEASGWGGASPANGWAEEAHRAEAPQEKSAVEQPPLDINHNAWADEEELGQGGGGEMQMTFE